MKKFNKHMPYKTDIPLIIIACVIALFIPLGGSPIFFIISISLLGMGVSCLMFVPMTLQPDLTDVDELISGKRREGICSGLSTLGRKVSQGLAFWVSGAILSASGLSADTPENVVRTAQAMMGVKIIYSIIPIALSVLIIIVSYTYKINAANHTMIKEKIAIKRQKGYTEMSSDEIKECEKITGMNFDKLWIAKKD
jgi:oligogalacturonide transporter